MVENVDNVLVVAYADDCIGFGEELGCFLLVSFCETACYYDLFQSSLSFELGELEDSFYGFLLG